MHAFQATELARLHHEDLHAEAERFRRHGELSGTRWFRRSRRRLNPSVRSD